MISVRNKCIYRFICVAQFIVWCNRLAIGRCYCKPTAVCSTHLHIVTIFLRKHEKGLGLFFMNSMCLVFIPVFFQSVHPPQLRSASSTRCFNLSSYIVLISQLYVTDP